MKIITNQNNATLYLKTETLFEQGLNQIEITDLKTSEFKFEFAIINGFQHNALSFANRPIEFDPLYINQRLYAIIAPAFWSLISSNSQDLLNHQYYQILNKLASKEQINESNWIIKNQWYNSLCHYDYYVDSKTLCLIATQIKINNQLLSLFVFLSLPHDLLAYQPCIEQLYSTIETIKQFFCDKNKTNINHNLMNGLKKFDKNASDFNIMILFSYNTADQKSFKISAVINQNIVNITDLIQVPHYLPDLTNLIEHNHKIPLQDLIDDPNLIDLDLYTQMLNIF